MIGQTLGHYHILQRIGAGGMGEVYRAHDEKLDRDVALKVLPASSFGDPGARARLLREARSAAALNHPHICTIHEVGEAEGRAYFAMELVEGRSMSARLADGPLPIAEVLRYGSQLADALAHAHERGVIHGDLKSANVMITPEGRSKVLDFGLAKRLSERELDEATRSVGLLTQPGALAGTLAYMAPEQLRGQPADGRSDVFALGVVLYEMAAGERPFRGQTGFELSSAILNQLPPPLPARVPVELRAIIHCCLEKEPARRYQRGGEVQAALDAIQAGTVAPSDARSYPLARKPWGWRALGPVRLIQKPKVVALTLLVALGLTLLLVGAFRQNARIRWARQTALPEITRLTTKGEYDAAFLLAREAEQVIASDPVLSKLWSEISLEISVHTNPEDSDVYMKRYRADEGSWEYLGRSPIERLRIPFGTLRWRVIRQGYDTLEATSYAKEQTTKTMLFPRGRTLNVSLARNGSVATGMVRVPGGSVRLGLPGLLHLPPVRISDYWIDRFEVMNKQFKEFVDAGGYQKQGYWKQPFVENGRQLSWEEAMLRLRDRTGRPGPSTWELGNYPEGQEAYPVTGISWYEAAAYAEYAGKKLPTIYHWLHAARAWFLYDIIPLSNFSRNGPSAVGHYQGMSPYGTFDMAGNAKEWIWNATGNKRFVLGGAWSEPAYMFNDPDAQSPFDRAPTYGFRCVMYLPGTALPSAATQPISLTIRDFTKERPVPDKVFEVFKNLYRYDPAPLDSVLDPAEENGEFWIRQKVTFNTAYRNERMSVYLYLPKNASPPFQTVVFHPGSEARILRSSRDLTLYGWDFVPKSGRALVYPIYRGHYERGDGLKSIEPDLSVFYREHVVDWYLDLARTVDYIQTRKDLDSGKLAFYGIDSGAQLGNILSALEKRFRVAVLVGGGFDSRKTLPEVDAINFAPRVRVPTLMVNGRYDHVFPLEFSQKPMFSSLGAPEKDKRHAVFDTGHFPPYNLVIKEVLDWLDRYLGPVK